MNLLVTTAERTAPVVRIHPALNINAKYLPLHLSEIRSDVIRAGIRGHRTRESGNSSARLRHYEIMLDALGRTILAEICGKGMPNCVHEALVAVTSDRLLNSNDEVVVKKSPVEVKLLPEAWEMYLLDHLRRAGLTATIGERHATTQYRLIAENTGTYEKVFRPIFITQLP